jgi:photosynthetic reaction center M subunit
MLEYQNLFTRVQVRTVPEPGLPIDESTGTRVGTGMFNWLAGKFGDAQIGPVYLGWTGTLSLIFGFMAFEIIGFNMWASVGWDPGEFIRQLPWLALEPPPPLTLANCLSMALKLRSRMRLHRPNLQRH